MKYNKRPLVFSKRFTPIIHSSATLPDRFNLNFPLLDTHFRSFGQFGTAHIIVPAYSCSIIIPAQLKDCAGQQCVAMKSGILFYFGLCVEVLILGNMALNAFFSAKPSGHDSGSGLLLPLFLIAMIALAFRMKGNGKMVAANIFVWLPAISILVFIFGAVAVFIAVSITAGK